MSAHLDRARLLLAQSRPTDAEREALLALTAQPNDPTALAILALSRVEQKKSAEALAAAQQAIGLAPDGAFFHYVHAFVLHHAERDDEAFTAIQGALRLDPGDPDIFSLLAAIELSRRNWSEALTAAEQALALNAEHVEAANFRAMALVRLGRKEEAMLTVDSALQRAPDNALSHANQGWNCLHRNDPRRAQDHFREALRLSPDLEYARNGMLEALKARNPVYRAMLAYFLWIGKLSGKLQWAFILGIWFGMRFVRATVTAQPQLGWFLWPVLGLFYAFIYLSWTAVPMFNLLLRFDRFGRFVLSREQRIASTWFGATFFAALGCLAWWLSADSDFAFLATVFLAILSVCVAGTFNRSGRTRRILGGITFAMALLAVGTMLLLSRNNEAGFTVASGFAILFIGFQIAANTLRRN